jgi:peptidoglycan/LPS O-acetylase OafA/YrhL
MTGKLDSLQIIRAFAASLVAMCHIWNDGVLPGFVVDLGGFGVDLFFALSGFIMCLTVKLDTGTKGQNAELFLIRRITRIFPIYIIC